MGMAWFRLYAEFASDPVVQSAAFEDQRHFVVLMCLKCSGVLDRPISQANRERIIFRGLGLDEIKAGEAKKRLMDIGLIDKNWQPCAWDKRQYKSDSSAERTRKYRENKESSTVTETSLQRHGDAPETDTEAETETTPKPPSLRSDRAVDSLAPKFEKFWAAYPNRKAKGAALKAFTKLNPNEQLMASILQAIERAKTSDQWRRDGGRFIPYPATWLNEQRWDDEAVADDDDRPPEWKKRAVKTPDGYFRHAKTGQPCGPDGFVC